MRTGIWLLATVLALFSPLVPAQAAGPEHPMASKTMFTDHESCDFCGMNRNAFARTRYVFTDSRGEHYTCSIHCVAAMSRKTGEEPRNVRVALYLDPATMVPADKAVYVIGSQAAGTMTATSKLAFADRESAEAFVRQNGGKIADFSAALAAARRDLGTWGGGMHGMGKGGMHGMGKGGMHQMMGNMGGGMGHGGSQANGCPHGNDPSACPEGCPHAADCPKHKTMMMQGKEGTSSPSGHPMQQDGGAGHGMGGM